MDLGTISISSEITNFKDELYRSTGPTKPSLSGFLAEKSWFIVACCSTSGGRGLGKCDGDRVECNCDLRKGVQDSELAARPTLVVTPTKISGTPGLLVAPLLIGFTADGPA